jgi:carbamoyltransferase
MKNISIYGSHNSALALEIDGKVVLVLEAERFVNYKNAAFAQYKTVHTPLAVIQCAVEWIMKKYNIDQFDTCYHMNDDIHHNDKVYRLRHVIPAKQYVDHQHHEAHAAGCFYQSPYEKALIFSFDGGGNDGKFNVYLAERETGVLQIGKHINPLYNHEYVYYDLGFPYMIIAHYLEDIRQDSLTDGNLVYPGKLMGLASYGTVNKSWLPYFIGFYKSNPDGLTYNELIQVLGQKIGVQFNTHKRISGKLAHDIAATSQRAFEECFLEIAKPYLEQYPTLPVCVTGGCALNIILNTRLVNEFNRDVFVGPNPNDCGLAVGMLLNNIKPKEPADITYAGLPLLDYDLLSMYSQQHHCKEIVDSEELDSSYQVSLDKIVSDLVDGKIVGVARETAEHGPRALGNRSILCNPSIVDMKDTLNAKVKNREWYRPFAPVVRLEDVNKYFEWNRDSRWMSFCPTVREEWRDALTAITHVDNTARVQTVTREQNPWLYELLTRFEKQTGIGVLLNTSFNVNGKPILSTLSDAFYIYTQTQMDSLIVENLYFSKETGYTF